MTSEFTNDIQTLNLSAASISQMTNWPEMMTNDYLTNLRNFVEIARKADELVDRVTINEENIDINAVNIEFNAQDIEDLQQELGDHIASNSEHGVAGDNVGTQDFCTASIGGVVLLAGLIADLIPIATVDLLAAPVAYDQTYTQLVTDLTNENKAKINEIVIAVNKIISGQITAKQMAAI